MGPSLPFKSMEISHLESVEFSVKGKTSFCVKIFDKNTKYQFLHDKGIKKKHKIEIFLLFCYTAFRVPGSKQLKADRSSVFNMFYVGNSGKEKETRMRLANHIDFGSMLCIDLIIQCKQKLLPLLYMLSYQDLV